MKLMHLIKKQFGVLSYNTEGVKTAQEFGWDNSAEKLMDALKVV